MSSPEMLNSNDLEEGEIPSPTDGLSKEIDAKENQENFNSKDFGSETMNERNSKKRRLETNSNTEHYTSSTTRPEKEKERASNDSARSSKEKSWRRTAGEYPQLAHLPHTSSSAGESLHENPASRHSPHVSSISELDNAEDEENYSSRSIRSSEEPYKSGSDRNSNDRLNEFIDQRSSDSTNKLKEGDSSFLHQPYQKFSLDNPLASSLTASQDFSWPSWVDPNGKLSLQQPIKEIVDEIKKLKRDQRKQLGDHELPIDIRGLPKGKAVVSGDGWHRGSRVAPREPNLLWTFTKDRIQPTDPRSGPEYLAKTVLSTNSSHL